LGQNIPKRIGRKLPKLTTNPREEVYPKEKSPKWKLGESFPKLGPQKEAFNKENFP